MSDKSLEIVARVLETYVENIWPPGALTSGFISKSAERPQELKVLMRPTIKGLLVL